MHDAAVPTCGKQQAAIFTELKSREARGRRRNGPLKFDRKFATAAQGECGSDRRSDENNDGSQASPAG